VLDVRVVRRIEVFGLKAPRRDPAPRLDDLDAHGRREAGASQHLAESIPQVCCSGDHAAILRSTLRPVQRRCVLARDRRDCTFV